MSTRAERDATINDFLTQHCPHYSRTLVAGDASFRRYERITSGEQTLILMDAPPEHEDVRPFVSVAELLATCQLRAPSIVAQDETRGLLLLDDLGDVSFTRHLKESPEDEWQLYQHAIDALLTMHRMDASCLRVYDTREYLRELTIFSEWFLKDNALAQRFETLWKELLLSNSLETNVFVHRDYHADNLMWLPEADALNKVGLLDFQDALLGDGAYDMVSLLEDARRDVNPETVTACMDYYIEQRGCDAYTFRTRYAILGAQRNCKIIGIFHRLCERDHKPHYLDFLPRVWAHLQHDLSHPALAPLQEWFNQQQLFPEKAA